MTPASTPHIPHPILQRDALRSIFADRPYPTPQECAEIVRQLACLHGMPHRTLPTELNSNSETAPCGGVSNVLDAVVRTILSQHTGDARARLAIADFEAHFGQDYEAVRAAPLAEVAQCIAKGGLAKTKSMTIKRLIDAIFQERGEISLEHLRTLSNIHVKEALMRYRGIGLKTASCILLLCLGRDSFPVDTHVLRIVKRLGWVPPHATCDQTHWHLEARVPPALHYALHLLFIRHGKACHACAARTRAPAQLQGFCPIDALRHA